MDWPTVAIDSQPRASPRASAQLRLYWCDRCSASAALACARAFSASASLAATSRCAAALSCWASPSRFSDSSPVTAPAASLARPFPSSPTPSTPALGPDSLATMISHVSHGVVFAPSSVTARYPGDLGHKRLGRGQRALAEPSLVRSPPAGHTEEALLTPPGDAGVCGWGQAGSGLLPVGDHRRVFIAARGLRDSQKLRLPGLNRSYSA